MMFVAGEKSKRASVPVGTSFTVNCRLIQSQKQKSYLKVIHRLDFTR
ncbi:hypothetical protein QM480_24685 [Flectobacillus sp. DC10W]|uniref:Uncharacterized protein n=1 Tax=Flectobacillus longus TaxID=2984207 RepID=A0ABT6YVL3_9BACT|nr:hypothetical protein [Flectobacillus longus]MDI9867565.1 hypothetical protein [Flectobacillus longus]